ncbi:MAG: PepSY domain-containing protein [Gammaproteobacteria bacterium]|nr:PepSY domain-containing protein [Gammaproteobacteria bacterium]
MYHKLSIWPIFIVAITAFSPIYIAYADNDYIEARQLQESGEILPLESILKRLRQTYPGKVLEVELEKEGGKIIYEIEILTKNGIVKEIYIDAKTGDIVFTEEDD